MAQIKYTAAVKEPGALTFTYKGRTYHKGQPQEVGAKEAAELRTCPEMVVTEETIAPPPEPEPEGSDEAPEQDEASGDGEAPAEEEPVADEGDQHEQDDIAARLQGIAVEDMTQEEYEQAVALGIVVPPEEPVAEEEPAPEPEPEPTPPPAPKAVTSKATPKKAPAKAKAKVK